MSELMKLIQLVRYEKAREDSNGTGSQQAYTLSVIEGKLTTALNLLPTYQQYLKSIKN